MTKANGSGMSNDNPRKVDVHLLEASGFIADLRGMRSQMNELQASQKQICEQVERNADNIIALRDLVEAHTMAQEQALQTGLDDITKAVHEVGKGFDATGRLWDLLAAWLRPRWKRWVVRIAVVSALLVSALEALKALGRSG